MLVLLVSLVTSKVTTNVVTLTCSTSNFSFKVILLIERWLYAFRKFGKDMLLEH